MLYRPNFCCHCGEKITRTDWLPWTSRRFCEFCQVEQMQHELMPKVAAAIALLIGAAGLVSYFSGAGSPESRGAASAKIRRLSANEKQENRVQSLPVNEPTNTPIASQQSSPSNTDAPTKLQRAAPSESSTEAVYFCGAMTRKGTPCTRRLKTRGRCWQHAGQLPAEDGTKPSRRP